MRRNSEVDVIAVKIDRREMLRITAAGVVLGHTAAALAMQPDAKPIQIGVIGTGSRGTTLLNLAVATGVEVPALCDIDHTALDQAINLVATSRNGRKAARFRRYPISLTANGKLATASWAFAIHSRCHRPEG